MPKVTKAEFARNLQVSKPRVSQYIAHGLPVLPDGKIDLEVGIRWVAENVRLTERNEAKGAGRAGAIVKPKAVKPTPDATVGLNAKLEAFETLIREVGKIAARSAVAAGTPIRVAYSLEQMVSVDLAQFAIAQLPAAARDPVSRSDWPFEGLAFGEGEPDWQALARQAGEEFDEDACDEFMTSLPRSKPA